MLLPTLTWQLHLPPPCIQKSASHPCLTSSGGAVVPARRFTFYFYLSVSSTLIWNNLDLTLLATIGLILNFLSMRAFHTYQAALMVTLFLWRDCHLGRGSSSDDLFDEQNQQVFVGCLHERFRCDLACLLCIDTCGSSSCCHLAGGCKLLWVTHGLLPGAQFMGRARGVCRGAGGGADAAKACAQVQPFLPAGGAAQEGEAAPAGRPANKS